MKKEARLFRGRPLGLALIVGYKIISGVFDIAAGLLIIFSLRLIAGELKEDPTDVGAHWLLAHVPFGQVNVVSAGIFVVASGGIKLILAGALWRESWTGRAVVLALLGAVGVYEITSFIAHPDWLRPAFLAMDLAIFLYVWLLLPEHLPKRTNNR